MIKTFTAKQFHENPREVYQAAVKGAVKVTHSHLGTSFVIKEVDDSGTVTPDGWFNDCHELFNRMVTKQATMLDDLLSIGVVSVRSIEHELMHCTLVIEAPVTVENSDIAKIVFSHNSPCNRLSGSVLEVVQCSIGMIYEVRFDRLVSI